MKTETASRSEGNAKIQVAAQQDDMLASITWHAASFDSLLSLIPAHLYLSDVHASLLENAAIDNDSAGGKFAKNKKKKDKEVAAAELKARRKEGKRAKLDPANQLTVPEIQASRLAAANAEVDMDLIFDANGNSSGSAEDDGEAHAGDTDEDMADSDDEVINNGFAIVKDKLIAPAIIRSGEQYDQSISEVRQKLQAKIEMLAKKRRGLPMTTTPGGSDKEEDDSLSGSRTELLEERRRKRGEMRDRRRRERKAERRAIAAAEDDSRKKGSATKGKGNTASAVRGANGVALGSSKAPALLTNGANGTSSSNAFQGSTARVQADSALSFSALKFDHPGSTTPSGPKSSSGYKNLPSDPKAALATLDARKARDEKRAAKRAEQGREAGGEEAERERLDRIRWAKANAAAEGVKIKDDETLLKKAAKRVEKQKAKSKKEWDDRAKDVADTQAARIKKRNENLAARKDKSKSSKKGGSKSGSAHKGKGAALGKSHAGPAKGKGKPAGKSGGRAGFEGKTKFGGGGRGGGGARKTGGSGDGRGGRN